MWGLSLASVEDMLGQLGLLALQLRTVPGNGLLDPIVEPDPWLPAQLLSCLGVVSHAPGNIHPPGIRVPAKARCDTTYPDDIVHYLPDRPFDSAAEVVYSRRRTVLR